MVTVLATVGTGVMTTLPTVSAGTARHHAVTPKVHSEALRTDGSGHTATFSQRNQAFTVLGVTWTKRSAPADLTVSVRYHQPSGWSGWQGLDRQDAPPAADAKAPSTAQGAGTVERDGSEPLVAPGADGYDVKVRSAERLPRDLKVMAIDAANSGQTSSTGATAAAEGVRPVVYSRADWGANENLRNCPPQVLPEVKAVSVHHTDGANNYTASQVPDIINGIYVYHTQGHGWCDIGYNVLVDRFGRLWEGRYGGLDKAVQPAAQEGFNAYTSAVAALGDFTKAYPTSAMVDAISRFASWKLGLYHIDPTGSTTLTSAGGSSTKYPAGTTVWLPRIFGHRDTGLTTCPGPYLYSQLGTIRRKARAYEGVALFEPRGNYYRMSTTDWPAFRINGHTPGPENVTLVVTPQGSSKAIYSLTNPTVNNNFSVYWDKKDNDGVAVPAGNYVMTVTGSSSHGTSTPYALTVTITGTVPPPGDPAAVHPVYRTPGTMWVTAHQWRTSCGPYSTATRCSVDILSGSTWHHNNWTYHDHGYTSWTGNHYAMPGTWTSNGRSFSTTCGPQVRTGARTCRTNVWNSSTRTWVIDTFVWLGDGR